MIPITDKAYKLLHEGVKALSQVEHNGIKIDMGYLKGAFKEADYQIKELNEKLKTDKIYRVWKKRYADRTNIDSTQQLGEILFNILKYDCPSRTETGKPKTDESALETLDIDFVKQYLQVKKLKKAKGTYLQGIMREVTNGFLHPSFNLHLAQTYRSSSDSPNFQNMPIRLYETSKLIRQCFIPRASNRQIIEVDYSGIEVHAAAWYHKDPVMLDYIHNKTKDMHRDMAQQCYALPDKEMTPINDKDTKRIKNIRYCGKNKFVFPQFYGDWYFSCAPYLWNAIDQMNLTMRNGKSIKEWLKHKGITRLGSLDYNVKPEPGTYLYHIKEVENDFWNRRFKKYKQWKDKWYNSYRASGKFKMLTGFVIEGFLKRNEVINYPVQGVAFHCLLWSLIRIQKILRKYHMKSLIIGQIHDSIVSDVLSEERKDYLEIVQKVMTQDIKKHWNWIITPIEIEAEAAPEGKSWFEKQKI